MPVTRVAAIDCGTNSIRLLVADLDPAAGTLTDVVRRTTVVRLGQDVDRTRVFAAEALERTFAATDSYAADVKGFGAERVRFVATSASRDVQNRAVFADGVRSRLGIDLDVISGDEEARLAYDGATGGLADVADATPPWVVLDIGGGSTELVVRPTAEGPVQGQSLDVGSVRMAERHHQDDPPTAEQIDDARRNVRAALATLTIDLREVGTLVGVAGTITTVAAMVLGLEEYDRSRIHRSWIPADEVSAATARLLAMTVAERRALPFMDPGRADVIGAGATVLDEVVAHLGVPGLMVSEDDILDGIAWSMV